MLTIFLLETLVITNGYLYYFEVNEDRTGIKFDSKIVVVVKLD